MINTTIKIITFMARASFHTLEMLSSPVLRERTEANVANKIMVQCAITSQKDTFISFLSVRGHLRINLGLYDTPTSNKTSESSFFFSHRQRTFAIQNVNLLF